MNKNVDEYVQFNADGIDNLCNSKKKFEKFIKILTLASVAGLLGLATRAYFLGTGSILGYLTYATAIIAGGAMMHKESSDIRKYYGKEKEYILGMKDREKLLEEEEYISKTNEISKREESIKEKAQKVDSLENKINMIRHAVVLTSVLSFVNPATLWIPAIGIVVYTAAGIYKIVKKADLDKEQYEINSLMREIKIDEILQNDKAEAEMLEAEKKQAELKSIVVVKKEAKVTPLTDREIMAEKIVAHIIKTSNQQEEKPKIHIKRKEGK